MDRKSQTMLEFLMTYGWAITLVVIVLVVLSSLGLFSPSSSAPTAPAISGFSQLVVTDATANTSTFEFSVDNEADVDLKILFVGMSTATTKYSGVTCNALSLNPGQTVYCGLQQPSLLAKQTTFQITINYTVVSFNLINSTSTGMVTISPSSSNVKILFK